MAGKIIKTTKRAGVVLLGLAGLFVHQASVAAEPALPPSGVVWQKLTTEPYPGKQDDVFFVNPKLGFYVNGAGKIFKSTDGGDTWVLKVNQPGTFFRCITFVDEKVGIAGNIGPGYFPNVSDEKLIYRTEDGGETWKPITAIEGEPVVGLCALEVVKTAYINAGNLDYKTRIVGVGRVGGPAAMIYSDDLGLTWKQHKLPDGAAMALDVHFFDGKRGLLASASNTDVAQSNGSLFYTEDGGETWREVYRSTRPFEVTWKMSFPTEQVGYVTLQSYNPDPAATARYVLKTTDGGQTWAELPVVEDPRVRFFGVAFVDENKGFVGAMPGGFETTDGGKTWSKIQFGNAVNKIRVVKDEAGVYLYAIGVQLHRAVIEKK